MIKKIFSVLAVIALAAVALPALAQQPAAPDVFVRDLFLSKTSYSVGETVEGQFKLLNEGQSTESNIYYTISLVGNYDKNDIAGTFFDTIVQGPVSISSRSEKMIKFTYKLPEGISGKNMGIQVQAKLGSDIPLGWADAKLEIKGENKYLTIRSASLTVGKETFSPTNGPMVHEGETPVLKVKLTNSTSKSVTVTPSLNIYNRAIVGEPLSSFNANTVTLAAGATKDVTIELPVFEREPRVYAGVVNFYNESEAKVAPKLEFRYIIDGQIATINSITSDKHNVKAGQDFSLKLFYSGTPYDILTREANSKGTSTLDIVVYNENDKVVAQSSQQLNFELGNEYTAKHKAQIDARALRVEAKVTSVDGKVLTTYKAILTPDYENIKKTAVTTTESTDEKTSLNWLFYVELAVVIICAVVYLVIRNRKHTQPLMMLIIAVTIGFAAQNAYSAFETLYWIDGALQTRFWNSAPTAFKDLTVSGMGYKVQRNGTWVSVTSVAPGEQYKIVGNAYAPSCTNSNLRLDYTTATPTNSAPSTNLWCGTNNSSGESVNICRIPSTGQPDVYGDHYEVAGLISNFSSATINTLTPVGESFSKPEVQFALGPFTAPSTPGTYNTWLKIDDIWVQNRNYTPPQDVSAGHLVGKMPLVVVNAPTNVTATPDACGTGKITVSWTNATGAASHNVYDNGVKVGPNATSPFVHSGLVASSSHVYYVEAVYANGNKINSQYVNATAPANCVQAFDYTLSKSGDITANPGGSGTTTISRTLSSGVTENVILSVTAGLPTGATASFGNNPSSPSSASLLSVVVPSTTATGTYALTIQGSTQRGSNEIVKTLGVTLNVVATTTSGTTTMSCFPTNPANNNQITRAPVGQPVRWVVTGPTSGTFSWQGTDVSQTTPSTNTYYITTYQTTGTKTMQVTHSLDGVNTTVSCTVGNNFSVSAQPGYKEF